MALHTKESAVDVLIIGAGPAGLMAANALARAGISVRIIDKRSKKVEVGQADGIQPRTIEVFQSYGIADRLIKEGNRIYLSSFYDPSPEGGIALSNRAARVSATTKNVSQRGRYSYSISLHQGSIENILIDSMRKEGLDVDRQIQPTAMEMSEIDTEIESPEGYPVKVTLRSLSSAVGENDTEVVRAKYVLGADGAHSWVRKELGFTMDGEQSSYVWGVVDTVPLTNFPDIRNRCLIHSLGGSMMIIPREDDIARLYTQLSEVDAQEVINAKGRVDSTKWGPERLLEMCKAQLQPYDITFPNEIKWWALYVVGQRVASAYSKDERLFIAGDACHTHSPKAGQGMNASMNDSHNLAWKLAYVLKGWADRKLLKTYEFERRAYAQELIDFDKKWAKLFSGKPRTEENKDGVSHEEMLKAYETFSGFTSGTGIQYPPSLITDLRFKHLASELAIGGRMPPQIVIRAADARPYELQDLLPSDTRFKIVIFAGDLGIGIQRSTLEKFVIDATSKTGFLRKYGNGSAEGCGWTAVFDLVTILIEKKEKVDYTSVPEVLRPHWSKIFVDDENISRSKGGNAYENFGISPAGAIAVVRPDGYIGMVAPLDGAEDIDSYFAGFMKLATVN
ncbi:hypothetical protein M0805_004842 [Coniferiporia weirii]|nr:hypothetical protein M0805_004842 [Coniferiporia weirii]